MLLPTPPPLVMAITPRFGGYSSILKFPFIPFFLIWVLLFDLKLLSFLRFYFGLLLFNSVFTRSGFYFAVFILASFWLKSSFILFCRPLPPLYFKSLIAR